MFGNDRAPIRRIFFQAWQKKRNDQPLEPLERLLAQIIQEHPEYHKLLENSDAAVDKDFLPEGGQTNPFLHLGMHVSLQEQIQTNRPAGILDLYQQLANKIGDTHETEHQLMECLGQMLWEAQRNQRGPDEQAYLDCIKSLIRN